MNTYTLLVTVLLHTSLACISIRPPRPPRPTPPPTAATPAPTPPPSSGGCRCGVPQVNRNRIVGGQPALKNEYPWLVALVQVGSTRPFCGGTLLSSKTVLTAAHCRIAFNSQIRVHVGEHDVTRADGEQIIGVSRFEPHSGYNSGTQDNDFAIITLSRDVVFSNSVMPACLPSASTNFDSVVATVAGWGTFQSGGSSSPSTPYEVDVETITNTACTTNTLYNPGRITSNMICARRHLVVVVVMVVVVVVVVAGVVVVVCDAHVPDSSPTAAKPNLFSLITLAVSSISDPVAAPR